MLTDLHHIPEKRRELLLKIWAGHMPVHDVTARLFYLDVHFPTSKFDAALYWLLKNGLTGRRFVEFVSHECAGSNLELHRRLLMHVEKENQLRKIYAGKDFRP